jgi:hypothetical protein
MKQKIKFRPTFNPVAGTLDFSAFGAFSISSLISVVNVDRKTFLYCPAIGIGYSNATGTDKAPKSILTLTKDCTGHQSTDELQVNYDDGTGNMTSYRFAPDFAQGVEPAVWDYTAPLGNGLVSSGGNAAGSQYLRIVMPTTVAGDVVLLSKQMFDFPSRLTFGVSQSQRVSGHELEISMVGVDANGNVLNTSAPADCAISGTITVASNVATINFSSTHTFKGGDRVIVTECQNSRLNVGPVNVTVVTNLQITVPLTLANGTYTVGGTGMVRHADPFLYAKNGVGLLMENLTVTNGSAISRRNGSSPRIVNMTIATVVANQTNTSPYSDSFNSANLCELRMTPEEMFLSSRTSDSTSGASGQQRFTQGIPDESYQYKVRIRAKEYAVKTKINGTIATATKSGTTTCTFVCEQPHNLSGNEFIAVSGMRDITNFPNTTQSAITVIDSTSFSMVCGAAFTGSTTGGVFMVVHGGVAMVGLQGLAVQSVAVLSPNIMTITVNTTATGALAGEYWELKGSNGKDCVCQILRMTGSTYEVTYSGSDTFSAVNCGGSFNKMTEHRIHLMTDLDYSRHLVELTNQTGSTDTARAFPTIVSNTPAVSQSGTWNMTQTGTWNVYSAIPLTVADVASAAITTSATLSTITPASGCSYSVTVPVTAVSGTNPTMDLQLQESDDSGTNWFAVYDFPRITATGYYRSPVLPLVGNRFRIVQTIGGTTPSFTRAINRLQSNLPAKLLRQTFDRTIVLTTLSSTSAVLNLDGCTTLVMKLKIGAVTTTAPVIQAQTSDDGGLTWEDIGTTLTGVASSIVTQTITANVGQRVRAIVKTAGVGVTSDYLLLKGF